MPLQAHCFTCSDTGSKGHEATSHATRPPASVGCAAVLHELNTLCRAKPSCSAASAACCTQNPWLVRPCAQVVDVTMPQKDCGGQASPAQLQPLRWLPSCAQLPGPAAAAASRKTAWAASLEPLARQAWTWQAPPWAGLRRCSCIKGSCCECSCREVAHSSLTAQVSAVLHRCPASHAANVCDHVQPMCVCECQTQALNLVDYV